MDYLKEIIDSYKLNLLFIGSLTSSIVFLKKKYFSGTKFNSTIQLKNKTVLITGANSGIGLATAKDLAERGATVILACRSLNKTQTILENLRSNTKNSNIFFEKIDLASLDSVRKFSDEINKKYERIDLLINNAGVMNCPYEKTIDGFEYQFQVNYLGHYLLTRLLLDKIIQSSPSRIINVTSKLYERGEINFEDINLENAYTPSKGYKQSKLCNILFSNYLEEYLKQVKASDQVKVFSISPGIVRTNLARYSLQSYLKRCLLVLFYPLIWFLTRSSKQGAQTILYCALDTSVVNDMENRFYRDCKQTKLLAHANDKYAEKKLWNLSETFVSKWL